MKKVHNEIKNIYRVNFETFVSFSEWPCEIKPIESGPGNIPPNHLSLSAL